MCPPPSGGIYGHCVNLTKILGQNSLPLAPSEKGFGNHQFLSYTNAGNQTKYYDPSYGVTYNNPADFMFKAVEGYAENGVVISGQLQFDVYFPTHSGASITFSNEDW